MYFFFKNDIIKIFLYNLFFEVCKFLSLKFVGNDLNLIYLEFIGDLIIGKKVFWDKILWFIFVKNLGLFIIGVGLNI